MTVETTAGKSETAGNLHFFLLVKNVTLCSQTINPLPDNKI